MKRILLTILLAALGTAIFGISGHITQDTTWETDQIVTGALYIDEGVTLTIMPGVHVTFPRIDQNADGIGDVYIEVSGRLLVQGTVLNKVVFKSHQTYPEPSDWLGIKYITPQSGMLSTISNADILYAHEPLFVNGRNLTLNNMRIAFSGDYGMRINNTFLTTNITNCTIEENAGYGLLIEAGPVNITGLVLYNNGNYGIKLMEPSIVTASDVVASTNGDNGIWVVGDQDATFSNSRSISNARQGVLLDNALVAFTNCDISNNAQNGVIIDSNMPSFTNCSIRANTWAGIIMKDASPNISMSEIVENGVGVAISDSSPSITYNHIYGNRGDTNLVETRTPTWPNGSNHPYDSFQTGRIETITFCYSAGGSPHPVTFVCNGVTYFEYIGGWSTVEIPVYHEVISNEDLYYSGAMIGFINYTFKPFTSSTGTQQVIVYNDAGQTVNLNYNWWNQVTGVDALIYQLNPGTASYETYLSAPLQNVGCTLQNLSPSISILSPEGMTLNPDTVNINWVDRDLDDNAMLSLYYTEDPSQTGTLIVDNISEDSNINSYNWNLAGMAPGTYYIIAVINDGVNAPVTAISPGRIMIGVLEIKMPANATGVAGTTVEIPVLTYNTVDYYNILSFQFTLVFNSSIIQATGINTDGTLTAENWTVYANTSTPGQISVNGFSTQPLNSSGELVKLVFNVQPGAINYSTSPLNFADCVLNNGSPEPLLTDGLLRVVNQYSISGNVNYYLGASVPVPDVTLTLSGDQTYQTESADNGHFNFPPCYAGNYVLTPSCSNPVSGLVVTPYDAALTAQFALGLYAFNTNQQKAADVNGDNQATVYDAALIAQYSVGLIDSFTPGSWGFSPPQQNYNLVSNFTNVQFLAYAIGDPSGNWSSQPSPVPSVLPINITARSGEIIDLPISWDRAFSAGFLQLSYDPVQLRYVDTQYSAAMDDMQRYSRAEDGILRIAVFGVEPVTSTDPVFNPRFEVINGDLTSSSALCLVSLQFDEQDVDLSPVLIIPDVMPNTPTTLYQNYPNPFNPLTSISYSISKDTRVRITLFNLRGEAVKELVNEVKTPGIHTVSLDAANLASGIYFYRMDTGQGSQVRKMVLLK